MSLERVLFQSPWIDYNDKLFHSRITLTYPQNLIFTTQFLVQVMNTDIYKQFPYAEKINFSNFKNIDWKKAIIVFDHNLRLILAPDPVHELVRLDRRLQYEYAQNIIFDPFRWSFFEMFKFQFLGIFIILIIWTSFWLIEAWNKQKILVLSNKASTFAKRSNP